VANPIASGQYRAVAVDGGPGTDTTNDIEVDLDQQALLSTAPTARQQAYFAPNTNAGFNDVFAHVFDDVTGSPLATAPNPHIAALSVSWGACEALTTNAGIAAAEPIIDALVAAGVTIFSSSGDDGIYDCQSVSGTGADDAQEDVDYPASSPAVIGVGGTNLSASTSANNTGSNWAEKAWSCTSPGTCENQTTGTGGTGGGASGSAYGATVLSSDGPVVGDFGGFAKPSYQGAITNAPFAAATHRLVPDIAADGDPQTGFVIYTSDAAAVSACGSHSCTIGGTSLAAPESAAGFVNLLGDLGRTTGVGDLHTALYAAYNTTKSLPATSPFKTFRDITTGTNGSAANAHLDPSVSAAAGYDTTTGLGAPLWPALASYIPPSVTHGGAIAIKVKGRAKRIRRGGHTRLVGHFKWKVSPPPYTVVGATVVISKGKSVKFTSAALSGKAKGPLKLGKKYTITVTGYDAFGDRYVKTKHVKVKAPGKHGHRHHHHHHHHHGH
jgi:hypothetical protein